MYYADADAHVSIFVDIPPAARNCPLLLWVGGLFRAVDDYDWLENVPNTTSVAVARIDMWGMAMSCRNPFLCYRLHVVDIVIFVVNALLDATSEIAWSLHGRVRAGEGLVLGGHSSGAGHVFAAAASLQSKIAGIIAFAPSLDIWPPIGDKLTRLTMPVAIVVGELE